MVYVLEAKTQDGPSAGFWGGCACLRGDRGCWYRVSDRSSGRCGELVDSYGDVQNLYLRRGWGSVSINVIRGGQAK